MNSMNCLMIMTILFSSISFGFGHNLSNGFINIYKKKNNLSSTTDIDKGFEEKCKEAIKKTNDFIDCLKYFTPKLEKMSLDDQLCCGTWYIYQCSKDLITKACSSIDSNKAKELNDNLYKEVKKEIQPICKRGVDESEKWCKANGSSFVTWNTSLSLTMIFVIYYFGKFF